MPALRVLHLLTSLGPGGAEIWLLNMLREFERDEVAIDFCLKGADGPLAPVARELGATVHSNRLTVTHVPYLRGLARIIEHGRYDIVHSHEFAYAGLGVAVARHLHVPIISTFHHWLASPQLAIFHRPGLRQARAAYATLNRQYAVARATFVTALSRKVLSTLAPGWQTSPRCRLLSLSTAIPEPLAAEDRRMLRASIGIGDPERLILHVGRFIDQKNHVGLLDVFERVHAAEPRARLAMLGQGPLLEEILAEVRRRKLEQVVQYLGLRNDVPRLLSASDLFLFPSKDEGFGLAALEANAAGLPVVGSDIPGLDEAVVAGKTAFLSAPTDVGKMVENTLRLLGDEDLAKTMGRAGRLRVEKEYSHAQSAAKLRDLYHDAIRRNAG